jgi:subtilisin family serine protease
MGICPACPLISIPVMDDGFFAGRLPAAAVAVRIARAVDAALHAGAAVIQMSAEFLPGLEGAFGPLLDAAARAASRGVRLVVSAGNHGRLGGSPLLAGGAFLPVAMSRLAGGPHKAATLGPAIGRYGLMAPGEEIPGADPEGGIGRLTGSSFAACFATGGFALLRSLLPGTPAERIWDALLRPHGAPLAPASLIPPDLDCDASLESLTHSQRRIP